MPFCKGTHANIYYEVIGEGIPIIMLHGFSPDHRLMKGCMEPIFKERDGWSRIYMDLPGMGKTKNYENISNSDDMLWWLFNKRCYAKSEGSYFRCCLYLSDDCT